MLPAGQDAAEAFYRIIDAAYERRSVAVTSNIHPSGFDTIMPKTLATATVDRLLHHAHLVLTKGDSHQHRCVWILMRLSRGGGRGNGTLDRSTCCEASRSSLGVPLQEKSAIVRTIEAAGGVYAPAMWGVHADRGLRPGGRGAGGDRGRGRDG